MNMKYYLSLLQCLFVVRSFAISQRCHRPLFWF